MGEVIELRTRRKADSVVQIESTAQWVRRDLRRSLGREPTDDEVSHMTLSIGAIQYGSFLRGKTS
jgi:DNA-directed RNA polymerase specialized sigma subunit